VGGASWRVRRCGGGMVLCAVASAAAPAHVWKGVGRGEWPAAIASPKRITGLRVEGIARGRRT
jgi:hypothetical protein